MQKVKEQYLRIPSFLRRDPHYPGDRYAPESQAERLCFEMGFCSRCKRGTDPDNSCSIQVLASMHDIDDEQYPDEWTYSSYGQPTCTGFVSVEPAPEKRAFTGDLFS